MGILYEDVNPELPPVGDACNYLLPENRKEGEIRRQPPAPRRQEYYGGYDNITHSDWPLVLSPLPHGHTFVVTSSMMQILMARGLFSRIPSEDQYLTSPR